MDFKKSIILFICLFLFIILVLAIYLSDNDNNNIQDLNIIAYSSFWDDLDDPSDILTSQLNNDAGFITDGNTNWNNIYGFYNSSNILDFNYWTKSGTDIYYNEGNVGIGTSSPSYDLDLADGSFGTTGVSTIGDPNGLTPQLIVNGGASGTPLIRLMRTAGTTKIFDWSLTGGALSFADFDGGNPLSLRGGSNYIASIGYINAYYEDPRPSYLRSTTQSVTGGADLGTADFYIQAGAGTGAGIPGNLNFDTADIGTSGTTPQTRTTKMTLNYLGNLGIGETNPQNKLDVSGGMAIGSSYSGSNTAPTDGLIVEGNVGIGLSNPKSDLEIKSSGTSNYILRGFQSLNNTNAFYFRENANSDTYLDIFDSNGSVGVRLFSDGNSYFNGGNVGIGATSPNNLFEVAGGVGIGSSYADTNTAPTDGLIVEGNVGIGLVNPGSYKLRVNGDTRFDGDSIIYTDSGNDAFYVTRFGQTNTQNAKMFVDDRTFYIDVSQDENESEDYSNMHIRLGSETLQEPDFIIFDYTSGTAVERFHLDVDTGNVGIGVTDPDTKLEVAGNIHIQDLEGTYTGGSAYVCVYNNGTLYTDESAC
jgi:hypothetical protein